MRLNAAQHREDSLNKFDRVFWNKVWSLTRLYWSSAERGIGVKLLAWLSLLSVGSIALGAYASYLNRDSTNALVGKHLAQFYHYMLIWVAVTAIALPVTVFLPYLGRRLYIEWREWLTYYFTDAGFAHHAFYRMGTVGKVDNPDQRISDDIGSFVGSTLTFTVTVGFALGGVATYFAILWSISPSLALILIGYAVLGTYFSVVIGRRLVGLNYYQERYQADFRFGLVHVRDNAEPIFIYGGERHENDQLRGRFSKVVENFNKLILWQRNLGFFTESYGSVVALVPYWFLAGTYVAGRLQFGQVVQAATAFMALHAALSIIVTGFPSIAEYANQVTRLSEFLDEAEAARLSEIDGREMIEIVESPRVGLEHLTVLTPGGGKRLISDLTADASALGPLLIKGPSGTGKTSLMRAMAGLWREGSGIVTRPALADVMFLPQRPYMILGSLRDQLTYPRAAGVSDEQLLDVLRVVNLSDLCDRFGGLGAEMHWADVLSPGEQQRLAFARLLLNRPSYAFLDEATSSLDVANEQLMYELMNKQRIPFLSSGHRPTLLKFHRNVLELSANNWRVEPSAEFETYPSAS
ncbi:ABC transporter ATP-binding protein/permease [Candidatus Binatus sp.]|uniref:ABC transporter ATP-binding protein/permease n=1 Tax=Candidatus Binatus sp. TaxID=2811406 RepID=UPI003C449E68